MDLKYFSLEIYFIHQKQQWNVQAVCTMRIKPIRNNKNTESEIKSWIQQIFYSYCLPEINTTSRQLGKNRRNKTQLRKTKTHLLKGFQ